MWLNVAGRTFLRPSLTSVSAFNRVIRVDQVRFQSSSSPSLWRLLIQAPLSHLRFTLSFNRFQRDWDPTLSRKEFLQAAKHAFCVVTRLIGSNSFGELKGLLSKKELQRLRHVVETEWDDQLRNNVQLEDSQVMMTPVKVLQQKIAYQRFCDIELDFIAVKNLSEKEEMGNKLLFMFFELRFHRDYSEGKLPNWVIRKFHLCNHFVVEQQNKEEK